MTRRSFFLPVLLLGTSMVISQAYAGAFSDKNQPKASFRENAHLSLKTSHEDLLIFYHNLLAIHQARLTFCKRTGQCSNNEQQLLKHYCDMLIKEIPQQRIRIGNVGS
jgi:hypothetical protein